VAAAPGRLDLIRNFINTLDREENGKLRVVEPAADRGAVAAWLRDSGLLGAGALPTDRELDRAIAVREALRAMAYANHDDVDPEPEAVAVLNEAGAGIPFTLSFDRAGASLAPGTTGVEAAIGTLLAIVAEAMAEGTWSRLKACAKDTCRWAFYDTARNRSGRWCSMAVCGNRVKAERFRSRSATGT
jgi:predicted RNA-binding Zn ribbon-like protein